MFLLGLIIIVAIIYFVASPNRHINLTSRKDTEAEDLLKKRFVSGEIDEEIYKKMLRTLRSN